MYLLVHLSFKFLHHLANEQLTSGNRVFTKYKQELSEDNKVRRKATKFK